MRRKKPKSVTQLIYLLLLPQRRYYNKNTKKLLLSVSLVPLMIVFVILGSDDSNYKKCWSKDYISNILRGITKFPSQISSAVSLYFRILWKFFILSIDQSCKCSSCHQQPSMEALKLQKINCGQQFSKKSLFLCLEEFNFSIVVSHVFSIPNHSG